MDPSNVETSAPRVFVSHSTKDSSVARLIAEALEEQGFPCWIAPRDVPPGGRYGEAVIDGINVSAGSRRSGEGRQQRATRLIDPPRTGDADQIAGVLS